MQPGQSIPAHLPRLAARFDLTSADLAELAQTTAERVQRLADLWNNAQTAPAIVLRTLRGIAKRRNVYMPGTSLPEQCINRMSDPAWWRRALRKRFRAVELHAIQRGAVHRSASPYISADGLRRFQLQQVRNAEQLAALEAVNQTTGEALPMSELIESSLSNPANRRMAMMARIRGIEQQANSKGHRATFLTITCPSRMHPRHVSGAPNEAYDGTYPGKAHAYLNKLWRKALRRAEHLGLSAYGLRVVEPHHDACPHWHVLVFTPADQAEAFAANLRAYALQDSGDEPGAQLHRFKAEPIDPAKGSAVGYVAKYVSKSIDGEGVDGDTESDESGHSAAARQVAWARAWGIRQFQFFGVPPITPTRELYRASAAELPGRALGELHQACKANDYAAWLQAAEAYGMRLGVSYVLRDSTRYRGEQTKTIQGLTAAGGDLADTLTLITRCDRWVIQQRPTAHQEQRDSAAAFSPWTRINNCASVDGKGFIGADAQPCKGEADKAEDGSTRGKGVRHQAPLPDAGRGHWESATRAA